MKKILILILSMTTVYFSNAQVIRNVIANQVDNNIIVTYDLSSTNQLDKFSIDLLISLNGGHSWSEPLYSVSGDVGMAIKPSYNKKIVWNVLADRQELVGNDIQFKIMGRKNGSTNVLNGVSGLYKDYRNGNLYKWVRIGDQIWMAENMRYKIAGKSSAYNNQVRNIQEYGFLYNYNGAQEACPNGWHIPTNVEWLTMIKELEGLVLAGPKLKTTDDWLPKQGNNESGFSAKPGGMRTSVAGAYMYKSIRKFGYFWSDDQKTNYDAHALYLRHDFNKIFTKVLPKSYQISVRCIKD